MALSGNDWFPNPTCFKSLNSPRFTRVRGESRSAKQSGRRGNGASDCFSEKSEFLFAKSKQKTHKSYYSKKCSAVTLKAGTSWPILPASAQYLGWMQPSKKKKKKKKRTNPLKRTLQQKSEFYSKLSELLVSLCQGGSRWGRHHSSPCPRGCWGENSNWDVNRVCVISRPGLGLLIGMLRSFGNGWYNTVVHWTGSSAVFTVW